MIAGADGRSRDFYGEAAEKYGVNNNKRDGALMAQGVDWKILITSQLMLIP